MIGKKLIALFLISILLITCKKEKLVVDTGDPDCLTYAEVSVGGVGIGFKGYQIYSNYTQFVNPIFNPVNENEFIYTKVYRENEYTLLKYDLSTGKSQVLLEDKRTDALVAFTQDGKIVYIIDQNYFGIMNSDGSDKRIFLKRGLSVSSFAIDHQLKRIIMSDVHTAPVKTVLYTLDGSHSDTFVIGLQEILFHRGDWSNQDSLVTLSFDSTSYGISVIDFQNKKVNHLYLTPRGTKESRFNVKWHPDNKSVFFTVSDEGIKRYNAGVLTLVKANCDSKSYARLSISPSGNKMLVERINRIKVSDTRLHTNPCIAIMNIDGSEERLIDLE